MSSILSPETMRSPLTDASNRNNCLTPITEQDGMRGEKCLYTSPDQMSIVNSPLSVKGNADRHCISPAPQSGAGSKRNSTVSAGSIVVGTGKRKTHIGPWRLGKTLGSGATSRVRLAKHAVTGQEAAVKIVSKKSAAIMQSASLPTMDRNAKNCIGTGTGHMPTGIEREIVIMKLIEHPNVTRLYDVWENRGELYLVLEYVEGGDLHNYVTENGRLPEEEAVRLFRQIITGLGHCHRFDICHRDLKPENILLDREGNVKLADFGMAAMQPAGHWLKTQCGSPHYVAPELAHGDRYHGHKADIWSCGIILFVLLTGTLPFDGGSRDTVLSLVERGIYEIPRYVSRNAADLIHRILQKRPENRIKIQDIWTHPLLRKYEMFHQVRYKHYLGPAPPLSVEDCGRPVTSRQDIDIELLRNLQTLWWDVRLEELIERVLSPEPNHERMFYNALVKFRNEQLENYQGQPPEYSTSDYHHIARPQARLSKHIQNNSQGGSRRRSQYVQFQAAKETVRRKAPTREPNSSGTVESYDPFRYTPNRLPDKEPKRVHVSIHRNTEARENLPRLEIPQSSNPFLDDDTDGVECSESPPFTIVRNKRPKVNSIKSFQSKVSYSGSRRALSATPTPRSTSYKRNVCFQHIKSRSQSSVSTKARRTPTGMADSRRQPSEASLISVLDDPFSDRQSSPLLPAQQTVVRRRGITIKNCSQQKRVQNSDIIWKDEARKVSHELSQICEEAFNGSSLSAGCTDSTCVGSETPPTSLSIASPEASNQNISRATSKPCPTPRTPGTSPKPSYTSVELAETRRKLIEHSTQAGARQLPAHLVTVIGHLDRLIEQDQARQRQSLSRTEESRDSMSDLFSNTSNELTALPIISEELNGSPEKPVCRDPKQNNESHFSLLHDHSSSSVAREGKSIRVVPRSSFPSINDNKTLNIRRSRAEPLGSTLKLDAARMTSSGVSVDLKRSPNPCKLDLIDQGLGPLGQTASYTSDHKKWSLFRKSHAASEEIIEKALPEVKQIHPTSATATVHEANQTTDASIPGPSRHQTRKTSHDTQKGGFFRKFMRRKTRKDARDLETDFDSTARNPLLEHDDSFETEKPKKPRTRRPQVEGKSQNWFTRVFHIKPATKMVALNTSRIKGCKDVYKMLREGEDYGIEEVHLDKANNVIYGRVGEANILNLRPVEFSAEFYTVVERGRQANLSLVRFKQERGAASSFNKVVEILGIVMKERGLLVEDPIRAKEMIQKFWKAISSDVVCDI